MAGRKILSAVMTGLLVFGMIGCGSAGESSTSNNQFDKSSLLEKKVDFKGKKFRFGMITDVGGVHDQSFNQSAWEGLDALQKKYPDQIEAKYLESQTDADYVKNIEAMKEENVDIIIGIGYKLEPAIVEGAKNYPDQKFAIVDAIGEDPQTKTVPKNVEGILFRADQSSFLVGYIAGKMTKTNKVGHMNGMDTPTMNEFAAGFYAGVWYANPKVEIFGQYANSFNDVAKGHSIADQMYSQGCDIVYACGGDTGNGTIDSAKEKNKFVIGVDRDQYQQAPKNMLTSAMKRVGDGVIAMCLDYIEGKAFGGDPVVYGLDSGAVGIAPSTQNLPEELVKEVKALEEKIKAGEIQVPNNEESLMKLFPNAPSKFMK